MTGKTHATAPADAVEVLEPMNSAQAQEYQRLRAHLSELRLSAAAESLTTVLDAAREELTHAGEFKYAIINKDFEVAKGELSEIIRNERAKPHGANHR